MTVINEIIATGFNGQIKFNGSFITIEHKVLRGSSRFGRGQKVLPIKSVTSVQLVPAGIIRRGYIEFTFAGASEKQSTRKSRMHDEKFNENAIEFKGKKNAVFAELRDAVLAALSE